MALGDPYAVPADLEARLGTTDPGTFTAILDAASRAVESFTGRQFNKTTTATARDFRAVDPRRLPVDDFHTTTDLAISVDGTAWAVSDVDPRPYNGVHNGIEGWPFFDLITVTKYWPWNRRAIISVTAQWGWDAVPAGIKQATLDVAEVMVAGATDGPQAIKQEAVRDYSVTFRDEGALGGPPEMARAVPYKRKRFGVA